LTQPPLFLDFVQSLGFLKTTFQKPTVLLSSGKETPKLVDFLDRSVLSYFALQK